MQPSLTYPLNSEHHTTILCGGINICNFVDLVQKSQTEELYFPRECYKQVQSSQDTYLIYNFRGDRMDVMFYYAYSSFLRTKASKSEHWNMCKNSARCKDEHNWHHLIGWTKSIAVLLQMSHGAVFQWFSKL